MQRAREVFYLYVVQNALTIALAIVLGRRSLAGLTSSVSIAYSVAAVIALAVLSRHQVRIASVIWARHVRRSLGASLVATLAMALAYTSSTANSGLGLIVRFSGAVLAGLVSYMVVVLLSQRSVSRRAEKSGRLG